MSSAANVTVTIRNDAPFVSAGSSGRKICHADAICKQIEIFKIGFIVGQVNLDE